MIRTVICGLLVGASLACAKEELPAGVEITGVGAISCVSTDQPGRTKEIRCTSSVSGRAFNFEAGVHFTRTAASITATSGAYGNLGLGLYGDGSGLTGNNGTVVSLSLEGAVEDTMECVGGSVPATVSLEFYEDVGDGVEGQHSHTIETSVAVSCG